MPTTTTLIPAQNQCEKWEGREDSWTSWEIECALSWSKEPGSEQDIVYLESQ